MLADAPDVRILVLSVWRSLLFLFKLIMSFLVEISNPGSTLVGLVYKVADFLGAETLGIPTSVDSHFPGFLCPVN